jgi:O-antigen/teichoic acid export membrane protein
LRQHHSEIRIPKSEIPQMSKLKALASQTLWYGGSNIAARMLSYLLTPLLTYLLAAPAEQAHYGESTLLYAAISLANVVFTYGMETAYFRFSSREGTDRKALFETSFGSLILSTIGLGAILWLLAPHIAAYFEMWDHPEYIRMCVLIIALDTLAALPFAVLRQENRPRRYAFVKLAGILVNIFLTVLLIAYAPRWAAAHYHTPLADWYDSHNAAGYILFANLAASAVTFLLLLPEWKGFRFRIDGRLLKTVLAYSLPFVLIGMGGMINETFDRILLQKLLPGDSQENKQLVGIYSACYRIAIFITLFIQAFRMAAEPFFFRESGSKDAPKTYARVMKWFVIVLCTAFLFTSLFLADIWKYLVGSSYRSGLYIVPILLLANVALGIYYNLAVWYKITGQLKYGIIITFGGAAITLLINYFGIPHYGILASAWATAVCYISMMAASYFWGQKHYPIPYPVKKLLTYLVVTGILFGIQCAVNAVTPWPAVRIGSGFVLFGLFFLLLMRTERKELGAFPVIGRFFR